MLLLFVAILAQAWPFLPPLLDVGLSARFKAAVSAHEHAPATERRTESVM